MYNHAGWCGTQWVASHVILYWTQSLGELRLEQNGLGTTITILRPMIKVNTDDMNPGVVLAGGGVTAMNGPATMGKAWQVSFRIIYSSF